MGASKAWTGGLTITNCGSSGTDCDSALRYTLGSYYQWGNNADVTSASTSGTQVNASGYGPGNYYNSAIFITSADWSSVQNDNLWGNTANTSIARQ